MQSSLFEHFHRRPMHSPGHPRGIRRVHFPMHSPGAYPDAFAGAFRSTERVVSWNDDRILGTTHRQRMSGHVQSVIRAFDLMRVLAGSETSISLAELAAETSLPKSTTRRMLATLESVGAVARGLDAGTYRIGSGLSLMGATGSSGLHAVAPVFVRDAMAFTGEAATIALLDQGSVIFTEQINGPNPIQVPESRGLRFPPHSVSSGLALMSGWGDEAILDYCEDPAVEMSDVTAKVREARRRGYLWHIDKWIDGISAVAAPVRGPTGQVTAALGCFGPSYRFPGDADREFIGHRLAGLARQLALHLT